MAQFKGQLECLDENTKKHITLSVPIKKEKWKWQDGNIKNKVFNNVRLMASSLSNFTDNPIDGLHSQWWFISIQMHRLQQKLGKRVWQIKKVWKHINILRRKH